MHFRDKIKNSFLPFRLLLSSLRMRGSMPWIPDQVGNDSRKDGDLRGHLPGSVFRSRKTTTGFSLIELMVVIGIFAIISGVVIFDYGKFSSNLVVTNLAYEAALAVRQAQVYGISVKQTLTDSNFNASYGVWFDKSDSQNFYLFADKNNNNKYDSDSEREESFGMNGSNNISRFCVTDSEGVKCSNDSSIDSISIIFKRPEPNAKIYAYSGETPVVNLGSKAEIMFTSGRGDKEARMTVTNTGQISIDSCNNPSKTASPCPVK
ncbi:MAG: type II secretion system protein [bacterium]